jgi:hypothetical protein
MHENEKDGTYARNLSVHNSKRRTIGEELFLVYLKRRSPADEEEDEEPPTERRRKMSIGEELFNIHLKRSCHNHNESDIDDAPKPLVPETKEELCENKPTENRPNVGRSN